MCRLLITWGTILLNIIPIRFETTEPLAILKRSPQQEQEEEEEEKQDKTNEFVSVLFYFSFISHVRDA